MLVLIGVAPAGFVVNMNSSIYDITRTRDAVNHLEQYYQQHASSLTQVIQMSPPALPRPEKVPAGAHEFKTIKQVQGLLNNLSSYDTLKTEQRSQLSQLRRLLMHIADSAKKAVRLPETTSDDKRFLTKLNGDLLHTIEYNAPVWIIIAVALDLSLDTMVGWHRVTITIGEKIGKKGMTYAQGISAQMKAVLSIGVASYTGMPVSTTHVLSSSVADTMLVNSGSVQGRTIKNILLAWVLTLPVSILLSGVLYWLALKLL